MADGENLMEQFLVTMPIWLKSLFLPLHIVPSLYLSVAEFLNYIFLASINWHKVLLSNFCLKFLTIHKEHKVGLNLALSWNTQQFITP